VFAAQVDTTLVIVYNKNKIKQAFLMSY